MSDLIRICYMPQLNQTFIIDRRFLNRNASSDKVIELIHKYVRAVHSLDDEGVKLGVSFTNDSANKIFLGEKNRFMHLTAIIFPLDSQEIEYEFERGDFFINLGKDPYIVLGTNYNHSALAFFFKRNPFENLKDYTWLTPYLPNHTGEKDFLPRSERFKK